MIEMKILKRIKINLNNLNFKRDQAHFLILGLSWELYNGGYRDQCGLSKKIKVSTLDIRITQSGLKVSHYKVPSSGSMD